MRCGAASGAIRQNLDVNAFARETGLRLRPVSVQQQDDASQPSDGLMRQWSAPASGVIWRLSSGMPGCWRSSVTTVMSVNSTWASARSQWGWIAARWWG